MADTVYLMAFETPPMLGPVELDLSQRHVTILTAFSIPNACLPPFQRNLRAVMPWLNPVQLRVSGHAVFGTEEMPVDVALVEEFPVLMNETGLTQLEELHMTCLETMQMWGGQLANPDFNGAGFSPHVTGWKAKVGTPMLLDSLTLVQHKGGFGVDVWNLETFWLGR